MLITPEGYRKRRNRIVEPTTDDVIRCMGMGPRMRVAGPRPVSWTPASEGANLAVWFRPEDLALGVIPQWNDASGNGNTIFPVGAGNVEGVAGPGGLVVADFSDPAGTQLKGGALTLTSPWQVFFSSLLYHVPSLIVNSYWMDFEPTNNGSMSCGGPGMLQVEMYSGNVGPSIPIPAVNIPFVVSAITNVTPVLSVMTINNGTPSTGDVGNPVIAGDQISIGNYWGSGGASDFLLPGWIGEFFIFHSPLVGPSLTNAKNYMQARWGQP